MILETKSASCHVLEIRIWKDVGKSFGLYFAGSLGGFLLSHKMSLTNIYGLEYIIFLFISDFSLVTIKVSLTQNILLKSHK